ncbi:sulfotransferase family protein [Halioxenophilus aromaticivorans]|uniref:Sulfotransferase n=1 Tax=Halioxenophilus aromaticivorans TaxID=1306992 RepID=A0AAV3U4P6_9ALTE
MDNSSTGVAPDFFIVGSVRTGSTMLRLMLGHHPEIARCDEMEYLLPGIEMMEEGRPIQAFRDFLEYDRIFQLYDYTIPQAGTYQALSEDIFRQLSEADGRRILGGTIHNDFALLAKVWPNCKYIFLDRDPRDVARSVINMGWAGTAWHGAEFWQRAKLNWQELSTRVPESQRLELRFEDLVAEPEALLGKVCKFLGVDYTPEMLGIDSDTTYRPPSKSEAASWEKKSKPREIAEVETRVGKSLIVESGYQVSDYPAIDTGGLAMLQLALRNKYGRSRHQWQQIGFKWWLLRIIANKTGSQALHRYIAPTINAKENEHLK